MGDRQRELNTVKSTSTSKLPSSRLYLCSVRVGTRYSVLDPDCLQSCYSYAPLMSPSSPAPSSHKR